MINYNKWAKKLKESIESYQTIIVFRHELPDYDALGSQFGLLNWIKDNYPEKKVYALGKNHHSFSGRIFPLQDIISDEELAKEPFLAIVLDTGNTARIDDKRYVNGEYILKIDHHPAVENYGNKWLVDTSTVATAQIIAELITKKVFKDKVISKDTKRYLYIAITGDSGRFLYSNTKAATFDCVSKLLKGDELNLPRDVYQPMYTKTIDDLKIQAHILSNFKVSKAGVAYYHLDDQTLKQLNITSERGKENINLLSNIEGIHVWVSFSEDIIENKWHVSIRSKEVAINDVAAMFGGGGHKNASGAVVNSVEESLQLIEELNKLIG